MLLHEFAHIHYGDVTAARGTMAVWRSFVLVALIPYLAIYTIAVVHGSVAGLTETGAAAVSQRDIVTSLALACLGYLARSDVLRNREIYADREALRNGAARPLAGAVVAAPSRGRDGPRGHSPSCGAATRAGFFAPGLWMIPWCCSRCRPCQCSSRALPLR